MAVDTLDAKRKALNGALKERGMKLSFTHLIAWAIVEAEREWPVMARAYAEQDGKPQATTPKRPRVLVWFDSYVYVEPETSNF